MVLVPSSGPVGNGGIVVVENVIAICGLGIGELLEHPNAGTLRPPYPVVKEVPRGGFVRLLPDPVLVFLHIIGGGRSRSQNAKRLEKQHCFAVLSKICGALRQAFNYIDSSLPLTPPLSQRERGFSTKPEECCCSLSQRERGGVRGNKTNNGFSVAARLQHHYSFCSPDRLHRRWPAADCASSLRAGVWARCVPGPGSRDFSIRANASL